MIRVRVTLEIAGALLIAGLAALVGRQLIASHDFVSAPTVWEPADMALPVAYRTTEGQRFNVYLTGYSFWDNTPPGSAVIARPMIRQRAGGTGTYSDPITVAVGHSLATGRQVLDFPAGTRFYFPGLRRYAIVEDVCGDGPSPEKGGCHVGHNGMPWLDIYVGGSDAGEQTLAFFVPERRIGVVMFTNSANGKRVFPQIVAQLYPNQNYLALLRAQAR